MRFQNTVTAARNDALSLNELNPAGVPEPETDARAWFSADCSFLRIKPSPSLLGAIHCPARVDLDAAVRSEVAIVQY
jgi:hypothetical protein